MTYYESLLESDWLGRTSSDYTANRTGKSTGWERGLKTGDALSSVVFKLNKSDDSKGAIVNMLQIKSLCTTFARRVISGNVKPRVVFTPEFNSYQQGNKLCVTLEPFVESKKFKSLNHCLDAVLGYCIHEAAHLAYTTEKSDNYLRGLPKATFNVKKSLHNIIEDERIENNVSKLHGGYIGYIEQAKNYCFDVKFKEQVQNMDMDSLPDVVKLFNTILYLIRYPKAMSEDLANKFEPELREVTNILTPYPASEEDVFEAVDKVYDVLAKYIDDEQEEEEQSEDGQGYDDETDGDTEESETGWKGKGTSKPKNNSSGDDDEQEEDESEGSGDEDTSDEGQDGEDENSDSKEDEQGDEDDADGSEGTGEDSSKKQGQSNGSDSGSSTDSNKQQKLSASDKAKNLGEALKGIIKAIEKSVGTNQLGVGEKAVAQLGPVKGYAASDVVSQIDRMNDDDLSKRQSMTHSFPNTGTLSPGMIPVIFEESKVNVNTLQRYSEALTQVSGKSSSLRAKIQQLNRNHIITYTGLEEGDFDDSLLVDAITGSRRVFSEEHKIINPGTCVGLLIDESGSMGGGDLSTKAREIAVLFERALDGVKNVDFYCYGHTTAISVMEETLINVYFEGRKVSNRKILGNVHHSATNRDGHALMETVGRMRKRVPLKTPIVLFMISDGEPSASVPAPHTGRTYTKACVDYLEKNMNVQIIHIAIKPGIPSAQMFNHYIEFTNPSKLVQDIGLLLKKVMLKQQQAIVI